VPGGNMKKEKGGMRSATMPKEHFERKEGKLSSESRMKYSSEFGNPNSLDKMTSGLSNYAKKNKMKYE
jgi:hypothetical protein